MCASERDKSCSGCMSHSQVSHPYRQICRARRHLHDEADRRAAGATKASYLCVQAFLCLALLYWTRVISAGFMMACGVERPRFPAHKYCASFARLYTKPVFEDDNGMLVYRNAKLYALFTGAQAERTLPSERRIEAYGWFNNELVALAKRRVWLSGLPPDILQGFLYVDQLQPHRSQWWGTALTSLSPTWEKG